MRCKECKYVEAYRRGLNKRRECYCSHPDKKYIFDYFQKNRMVKSVGFLSFSEPYTTSPTIKTAPKWCPLKKKDDNE